MPKHAVLRPGVSQLVSRRLSNRSVFQATDFNTDRNRLVALPTTEQDPDIPIGAEFTFTNAGTGSILFRGFGAEVRSPSGNNVLKTINGSVVARKASDTVWYLSGDLSPFTPSDKIHPDAQPLFTHQNTGSNDFDDVGYMVVEVQGRILGMFFDLNKRSIYDITDPINPTLIQQTTVGISAETYIFFAHLTGDKYIVARPNAIVVGVVDFTDPDVPVFGADFNIGGIITAFGVDAANNRILIGRSSNTTLYSLAVDPVTNVITQEGLVNLGFVPQGQITVNPAGDTAYVVGDGGAFRVVDLTTPATPTVVGTLTISKTGTGTATATHALHDGINHTFTFGLGRFVVVDVSVPATPTEVAFYETPASQSAFAMSRFAKIEDGVITAYYGLRKTLIKVDVSNPLIPKFNGWGTFRKWNEFQGGINEQPTTPGYRPTPASRSVAPGEFGQPFWLDYTDPFNPQIYQTGHGPLVSENGSASLYLHWVDADNFLVYAPGSSDAVLVSYTVVDGYPVERDRIQIVDAQQARFGESHVYLTEFSPANIWTVSFADLDNLSIQFMFNSVLYNQASNLYVNPEETLLFVVMDVGLVIFDIDPKTNIIYRSTIASLVAPFNTLVVEGNFIYGCNNIDKTLEIWDITDPAAPVLVGATDIHFTLNSPNGVIKEGNRVYVSAGTSDTITYVDVTNPAAPVRGPFLDLGASNVHLHYVKDGICVVGESNFVFAVDMNVDPPVSYKDSGGFPEYAHNFTVFDVIELSDGVQVAKVTDGFAING